MFTLFRPRRSEPVELEASHTAVMFHWPDAPRPDITVVWAQIIDGEELHRRIDALIEEHVDATHGERDVLTEVAVWWHFPDGVWESEEFVSHYYATGDAA